MVQTNLKYLKEEDYHGNLKKAVSYLLKNYEEMKSKPAGKHDVCDEFFYIIQEYETKNDIIWESHRKYLDIQLMVEGEEIMEVSGLLDLKQGEYIDESDFVPSEGEARISMKMKSGDLAIFFPEDAHKPGLKCQKNEQVKKLLVKVLI